MRFLIFLSFISAFRSTLSDPLLEDPNGVDLFDNTDGLGTTFFDDSPQLQTSIADYNPTPDVPTDPDSIFLDWTDPVKVAEVGDSCKAPPEGRRMRARETGQSCATKNQNTNSFGFPHLFPLLRDPPEEEKKEELLPPYFDPRIPTEDQHCRPPVPNHLCCNYNSIFSLYATIDGSPLYELMIECTTGKELL